MMVPEATLPDAEQRRRIVQELDTTFLVEAGAGSGKTQAIVDRMIALIETGRATIDQIAAITFTRKAAAELRERFQERMEHRLSDASDPEASQRLGSALLEIDRAYVGTIHSFCARLLRERPLEAGVDPAFEEVSGVAETMMLRESWGEFVESVGSRDPELLGSLVSAGLRPAQLYSLYQSVVGFPDVEIPAEAIERPDPALARRKLAELLARAQPILPAEEPERGWDPLQKKIRKLDFYRRFGSWETDLGFFEALEIAVTSSNTPTQNRWSSKSEAKDLGAEFDRCVTGLGGRTLREWWAYRYAGAVAFAQAAAEFHHERRMQLGRLTFQDLLMGAARLLRESPVARRSLARRYPFLLVDEFQDTDPVQAEVVFLLSAADEGVSDWTEARPRPGALFVVGDPKQSIYRFRRADIAVYNLVKRLLEETDGAEVLELVANFRSTEPFRQLVETAFRDTQSGFPSDAATEFQAKFAPLETQKPASDPGGVFMYEVEGSNQSAVTGNDARGIAGLIASQIRDPSSGRSPGDFLVLTWRKFPLNEIARALEAWDVPVQVSGGGVTVDGELSELIVLLRALGDPDESVGTLAVLVGLFFGIDYDQLYEYRKQGHRLSFLTAPAGDGPVADALTRLHRWYQRSLEVPADILLSEIVDDTGLLSYAAAGELGGTRAGSLIYALEMTRKGMAAGATSIQAVADFLVDTLEDSDVEAPLEPGRKDVVRVMNIHKAKGLQAPVVILASPCGLADHPPKVRVERGHDGRGRAYFCVCDESGGKSRVLAQPSDWEAHAAAEKRFAAAEDGRLRYVAVTRAREELLVSRCEKMEGKGSSPWGALASALEKRAERQDLPRDEPPPRELLDRAAPEIMAEAATLNQRRSQLLHPSYAVASVTRLAKGDDLASFASRMEDPRIPEGPGGAAWGTVVHRVLEAAATGVSGPRLRPMSALVLREEGFVDDSGLTLYEKELEGVVAGVTGSDLWRRVQAADEVLVEVPVSFRRYSSGQAQQLASVQDPMMQIVDGVIDLAFREGELWTIVDWKTDRTPSEKTVGNYEEQIRHYCDAWLGLTGRQVSGGFLYFVQGNGIHEVDLGATVSQPGPLF